DRGSGGGLGGGLPGGLGQLPGTQAAGLGNLPANAIPTAGAPAQAFSQGLSTGSALGSLPPATGTGTPAAGQTAATPAAGLTSGAGVPSAGVAAAGATPPTVNPAGAGVANSAGTAGAAPAAMMLPPPGMGAPAAPVAGGASGAAPVAPAGNSATAGGSAPATNSAGSPGGSGGAVVVPAATVSAGAGSTRRERSDSPELAAAKALVRKLRRDSDIVNYACIEWAVGVFRREAGGATECVVMSNEGFGYIPWGVFLPRTARLLAADERVDNQFRERWFGSSDPAEVLAEYAQLRGRGGTHLVAMAVTADSPFGRAPGVEYAVCPREFDDGPYSRPILDDMHMHRLEAFDPQLYARIVQTPREVVQRALQQLGVQMTWTVSRCEQMTPELREMWNVLGTGDDISQQTWNQYRIATSVYFVNLSATRPHLESSTGERQTYQAQWVTARTMEFVQGWEQDLAEAADMVYAAATAHADPADFAHQFEMRLRAVAAELGCDDIEHHSE
ncbi:hypothetical protein ABW17_27560, partial [Mycobacterium nebraskense]